MNRILIENIRVPASAGEEQIFREASLRLRRSGLCGEVSHMAVHRKSIDARRKNITFVCSVLAQTEILPGADESVLQEHGIKITEESDPELPVGTESMQGRPVIIGFGPAGIFCALLLAECGFRPLVLEQGGDIDERIAKVDASTRGGLGLGCPCPLPRGESESWACGPCGQPASAFPSVKWEHGSHARSR